MSRRRKLFGPVFYISNRSLTVGIVFFGIRITKTWWF